MSGSIGAQLSAALPVILAVGAVLLTLLASLFTYRRFKNRPRPEAEGRSEIEEVGEEIKPNTEGLFSLFADDLSLFGQAVTTSKDIRVDTGETLYYLISGAVEVVENERVVLTREKNFFLSTPEWLSDPSRPAAISYTIKAKSVFYQLADWRDTPVGYVLLARFFRGTLYTLFNYLEVPPAEYDIRRVDLPLAEHPDQLVAQLEQAVPLGREFKRAVKVPRVEEFSANLMVLVLSGSFTVQYQDTAVEVHPGDLVGCLSRTTPLLRRRVITGAGELLAISFKPYLTTSLAKTAPIVAEYLNKLPRLLPITDAMIDWKILLPGERISATLPGPGIKLISSGYFLKEGDIKYFGIGSGRFLFEKEVLLDQPTPYIAIATRASEIIEVPAPYVTLAMAEFQPQSLDLYKRILSRTGAEEELDLPTIITFLPNDPQITQVEVFVHFLSMEINQYDTCTTLSSDALDSELAAQPWQALAPVYLALLLSSLQEEFSYTLLAVTSHSASGPTRSAINLSEIIFYLTINGSVKELELEKVWCKVDTVILHRDSQRKVRSGKYYGQRHHVEFPSIDIPVSAIKQSTQQSVRRERKGHCAATDPAAQTTLPVFPTKDLERFLRTIKGENVGLALGGGGARGIAHIGIIQALEEAGIPIDAVGGTSMGAFVGALYAEAGNNREVFAKTKRLSKLLGSVWRVLLDITYPICSMFTGKAFNWGLKLIFKSRQIEDLWLPYYCVTTDIAAFAEKTHKFGSVWRYVRASMSLSGYLPPLCDDGSLLMDGGYVNNVPADAMRSMGIRKIIAVDVGTEVSTNYDDYGDSLNGFYILFQKLFGTKRFLSLTEIQYRLAYITSAHKERTLKSDTSIKYLRPDLTGYKTMNFRQFDEIVAHGYQYGKKVINEWKKTKEYLELVSPKKWDRNRALSAQPARPAAPGQLQAPVHPQLPA